MELFQGTYHQQDANLSEVGILFISQRGLLKQFRVGVFDAVVRDMNR